jgi:hypothetical protein
MKRDIDIDIGLTGLTEFRGSDGTKNAAQIGSSPIPSSSTLIRFGIRRV